MFLFITVVIVLLIYFMSKKRSSSSRISIHKRKYVFITGCDTGFGFNAAVHLDSLGFSVIATHLTEEGKINLRKHCSDSLCLIKMDVTDFEQIQKAYRFVQQTITPGYGKVYFFVLLTIYYCLLKLKSQTMRF